MNISKYRKDFPFLQSNTIYFDNASTTLKPNVVIDEVVSYYRELSANVSRGDYEAAVRTSLKYEQCRDFIASFLNTSKENIVFTTGTSDSLNRVALGLNHLINENDVIVCNEVEHASSLLPWFHVAKEKKAKLRFIPLEKGRVTTENFKSVMDHNVKVVIIQHISNVLGYENDIEELSKIAHKYNALVIVDAAQSVAHQEIDVQKLDCDFLAFSAHKVYGPTGVGVLYGKYQALHLLQPHFYGGGSNARYDFLGNIELKEIPYRFESGTPAIEGVFGMKKALEYIQNIGLDKIKTYELQLKDYLIQSLKKLENVCIYNEDSDSAIVSFNVKGIFAQDVASYLSSKNIAVRSGQHCAKLLVDYLDTPATIRVSLSFYNTFKEIDYLISNLQTLSLEDTISLFF